MTKEEAKMRAKLYSALAEGKTIEFFKQGEWMELNDPDFMWSANKYRIKPESKYRPFKTKEECWQEMIKHQPFGWVSDNYYKSTISVGLNSIFLTLSSEEYSYLEAFHEFRFIDGTPFGIKEK